jgi:hypothetical protein
MKVYGEHEVQMLGSDHKLEQLPNVRERLVWSYK